MKHKEPSPSETPSERRQVSFIVAGDAGELSPNRRLHPLDRARLVKKWRSNTGIVLNQTLADQPFYALRVKISFTLRRGRLLDPDNAHSSLALKGICDAMKGGIFPDDTAACVEYGPITQEVDPRYRLFPEVVVRVEEAEGGESDSL